MQLIILSCRIVTSVKMLINAANPILLSHNSPLFTSPNVIFTSFVFRAAICYCHQVYIILLSLSTSAHSSRSPLSFVRFWRIVVHRWKGVKMRKLDKYSFYTVFQSLLGKVLPPCCLSTVFCWLYPYRSERNAC